MRKDVKLGFAIGGILFSVLIVYVLVISGGNNDVKPQQVALVTNETPAKTDKTPAPAPAAQQDRPRQRPNQRQQNASEMAAKPDATAKPEVKDTKPEKTETPTDPFKQTPAAPSTKPSNSASSAADQWAAALQGGAPPTLLTSTPTTPTNAPTTRATPAAGNQTPSTPTAAGAANTPAATTPIMASNSPAPLVSPTAAPVRVSNNNNGPTTRSGTTVVESAQRPTTPVVTTPITAGGRTHVVQSGETFSSIAATAYGNSAYYSHLIRANPSIDPKKLRPGMTINLPPEAEVKANNTATPAAAVITPSASTPAVAPKLDEKTEYRVESGDNLNKISAKLYGAANRWEKIYEANKALIGADPKNLKVGMILKLPEAPSVKQQ